MSSEEVRITDDGFASVGDKLELLLRNRELVRAIIALKPLTWDRVLKANPWLIPDQGPMHPD